MDTTRFLAVFFFDVFDVSRWGVVNVALPKSSGSGLQRKKVAGAAYRGVRSSNVDTSDTLTPDTSNSGGKKFQERPTEVSGVRGVRSSNSGHL